MVLCLHFSAIGFYHVIYFGQWNMSRNGMCRFHAGMLGTIMWFYHILYRFLQNKQQRPDYGLFRQFGFPIKDEARQSHRQLETMPSRNKTLLLSADRWGPLLTHHRQPILTDTVTQLVNNKAALRPSPYFRDQLFVPQWTKYNSAIMSYTKNNIQHLSREASVLNILS